jgi:MoxR-like ATPase
MNNEQFLSDLADLCTRHGGTNNSALTQPLTPTEAGEYIDACMEADLPFAAHGDPGVGKTDVSMQRADKRYAAAYGYVIDARGDVHDPAGKYVAVHQRPWFYDFRTALRESVDLSGLPYTETLKDGSRVSRYATPDILQDLDPRGGLFFFDEINRGSTMTTNIALSMAINKNSGKNAMPSTWRVGAAMNDKDTGITKLTAALNSRFAHFTMTTNLNDVLTFAIRRGWEPVVCAFLKMFPELLHQFDPKAIANPNARA